ncbi:MULTISPECIES: EscU/YscU/HrcU family type III secretion system export apparatus switch protein [Paenibacillus]|uniref:EscU/YscU/HrcU family type III secretion system export apparatus switch protein n=1 Tax=Paenibacillus TaxID=44249 RepID=UPI000838ECB7|nr:MULTISPECIES: EscU/YscU/HrcU family type III secretion system export apparatus switch protein [Paenibacillus]GIP21406.1 flagellar biosynthetic protein FlhB [Paenibacillus sp. J22TS3]
MNQKPEDRTPSMKRAVALKYEPSEHEAPVIAAKGTGLLAERILEKAKEHGIPVQEDPALVEVLSKLDLDQQIPPELYALVAEILSFIYRSDRAAEKGLNRGT